MKPITLDGRSLHRAQVAEIAHGAPVTLDAGPMQAVPRAQLETAEAYGMTHRQVFRRVLVPLMTGGILAGFVTSFITAAVELSATIMLVSADSQAPMSYGIYLYMQSVAGRGPGAALGVLAILVVAVGTYLSHVVVERTSSRLAPSKEHST